MDPVVLLELTKGSRALWKRGIHMLVVERLYGPGSWCLQSISVLDLAIVVQLKGCHAPAALLTNAGFS